MKKEIKQIESLLEKLKNNTSGESYELITTLPETPFEIGKSYLIRTVTLYYTGRVKNIIGKFIQLEEAAWIPDTGRWMEASEKGTFSEVEPFANDPWVNTDSIIDFQEITYKLPINQK